MKKIWIYVLFSVFLLAGCGSGNGFSGNAEEVLPSESVTEEQMQTEQKAVWGITLDVKDVTPRGLTLVCTQSGGEMAGELLTGSWYSVQQFSKGQWKQVKYTELREDEVGWTEEAWLIPMDDTVEWSIDWSWLYDKLPAGQYRIVKKIMDFRGTGEYDEAEIYAAFTIE